MVGGNMSEFFSLRGLGLVGVLAPFTITVISCASTPTMEEAIPQFALTVTDINGAVVENFSTMEACRDEMLKQLKERAEAGETVIITDTRGGASSPLTKEKITHDILFPGDVNLLITTENELEETVGAFSCE